MVGICPGSYFVTPILGFEVDYEVTSTKLFFLTYV